MKRLLAGLFLILMVGTSFGSGVFRKLPTTDAATFTSLSTGNVALKWKEITGNLDIGGGATLAHGCGANIVAVSLSVYKASTGPWISGPCTVNFDNNYLYFSPGTGFYAQAYRVIVWYQ